MIKLVTMLMVLIKFKQLIYDRNFSEILNTGCPDSAYTKFTSDYKNRFNEAFPSFITWFTKKETKHESCIRQSYSKI